MTRELVSEIVAAPDDDAPRLVYADWLSARGDPLGELIVTQCALDQAETGDRPTAETRPLRARVRALVDAHGATWLDPLFDITAGYYELRRGFVEHVMLMQPRLDAAGLLEAAPLLRSVAATQEAAGPIFAAAEILPIDAIRLSGATTLATIGRASAALPRLRRLELRNLRIDASSVRDLARLGAALDHLDVELSRPLACDHVLPELVTRPGRDRLRSLALANTQLADLAPLGELPALVALELTAIPARVPSLPALTDLGLGKRTDIDPIELLATLPALRRLRIVHGRLGDAAAIAIASSPEVARLTRLDLSHNAIGPSGARALADSPHLHGLVELDLRFNPIDDDAKHRLQSMPEIDVAV
jgi:uncharacterized protein (TIGR02996 family)